MKAVLLAAGKGSRLKPLTDTLPKCLVTINGTALLDIWLNMLNFRDDVDEIFINVSYLQDKVIEHLKQNWPHASKITIWNEPELLGTAGTLSHNASALKNQDVMVIHADNLSCFSIDNFINSYLQRPNDCVLIMMLFHTDSPSSCGIVELDEEGRLLRMHEKVVNPPGNKANGAVYIFSAEVVDWLCENRVYDISQDVIPVFEGKIWTWLNQTYHRDIGNPESYIAAQEEYLQILGHPELIDCPIKSNVINR